MALADASLPGLVMAEHHEITDAMLRTSMVAAGSKVKNGAKDSNAVSSESIAQA